MTPLIECSAAGRAIGKWRIAGRKPIACGEAEEADHAVDIERAAGVCAKACIHRHMRALELQPV